MRKKRLMYNTLSSLILQGTTIICGFILPRLILSVFGSEINGLVNSITQFLGVISFLELGVGAVLESALYEPLAKKDSEEISKVISSGEKFFKQLAKILAVYMVVLMIAYPYIVEQSFGWLYTASLIFAIGFNAFSQYYFGVVDRLLLSADQRGYIQYLAQTVTLVANTIACYVLINLGATIHMVKFTTSAIYLVRPIVLRMYVNRHYAIDRKVTYSGEPLKQKWNGIAQHIAAVVLDGTDTLVLTFFSSLSNVSVYSVYNLVTRGIMQLFTGMLGGFQSLLGEMIAKKEEENLRNTFESFEWITHAGVVFIFGCTASLILPFVKVYTKGITDAEYIQPIFAAIMVLATAIRCIRIPYNIMILAAGHYKQTQWYYIATAIINLSISIIAVEKWGLIGVAVGTLAAMIFHTIWTIIYTTRHLLKLSARTFTKLVLVDCITVVLGLLLSEKIMLSSVTYYGWIFLAIKKLMVWIAAFAIINTIAYNNKMKSLILKLKKRK